MSELSRSIQNRSSLEDIEDIAEEEKNINEAYNGIRPIDAALGLVGYDPSLHDTLFTQNNYARDVIYILLNHNADASTIHEMYKVANVIDPTLLRKLMENGFQANTQDDRGHTLLVDVLSLYHLVYDYREPQREQVFQEYIRSIEETIQLLIQNGADVSLQMKDADDDNLNGGNAIHVMMGIIITPFILQLFRSTVHRDNINLQTDNGTTPLIQYAITRGQLGGHLEDSISYEDMVNELLTNGADIMARDSEGRSALDHAILNENNELIAILREKEREIKESAQKTIIAKSRRGAQYGVHPALAKRITNFLGGKRRTQKGRKAKKRHTRKGQKGQTARTQKGRT